MAGKIAHDNLDDPILQHAHRDFAALRTDQTVAQALADLRKAKLAERIVYFYVTDAEGRLAGVVPTRRLLMSQPDAKIASVMVGKVAAIPATATVLDACEFFIQYKFLAFPVIDEARRLVGVIDVGLFADEVFDVAEKQSADDVFQLIGVRLSEARRAGAWAAFRDRFPWLLCNLGGGLACALVAGIYEGLLKQAVVLAVFIPVVLALSESVSIQSMTITLQGLRRERAGRPPFARALGKELVVALLLGLGCGVLVAGASRLWSNDLRVALIVGGGIWLSMVTACLLGIILPTAANSLKWDPKLAAGPIVLAAADIATLLFYLNLAGLLLSYHL